MRIQKENQVIYALVNKQKKTFFITHGTEKTLRETYRHHIKMRRNLSAKFISNCGSIRPCLFVLERINPEEKINLMLIWLRILRENGFESSNHPNLIEMSENLYFDNKIAYEKRKDIDLTSIFSCEKCLVPFLKKTPCANNPALEKQNKPIAATSHPVDDSRTQINLRLSTKEHEHIRKMAKEHSIPMNHYIVSVICTVSTESPMIHAETIPPIPGSMTPSQSFLSGRSSLNTKLHIRRQVAFSGAKSSDAA